MRSSSRAFAAAALAVAVATGAAACSSSSSNNAASTSSDETATVNAWLVTTATPGSPQPSDTAVQALAAAFDQSHPGDKIVITFVQNNSYKAKIQQAMADNTEPQIFWTWGGGPLQTDIAQNKVVPLTTTADLSSSFLSQFLPSSLGAVTDNGSVYGVPVEGTQPVYFFYNKSVFSKYGLTFPSTWSDLLSDVAKFKADGVIPISVAGGASWTELMYLEYLVDRIGGASVAKALQSNQPDAWSNPAVSAALTDIQQLIQAGAFETGYGSKQDDAAADVADGTSNDALVYDGKAAMQLMGDWDISSVLASKQSFISTGDLGMAPFPTVVGNKYATDLAGNTASYVSISKASTPAQIAVAEQFFQTELASSGYAQAQVAAGEVPVISGASSDFSGSLASYDTEIYNNVQDAPNFQYSWDQAMTPGVSAAMLTNLSGIFNMSMKPSAFVAAMNAEAAKDATASMTAK
jgi:raffinose/stachyose/melibiose transport system substrate-binding protein